MTKKSLVPIQLPADPTAALEAATKQYVDAPFTSVKAGVVPASGGVATNFLCADGTWKATPGGTPPNNAVTNAVLADMAGNTIKGNNSGSAGDPVDLSVLQTKTMLALENVNNTTDANKPVSTAQATADGLRVLKVGDVMTGNLRFTKANGAVEFYDVGNTTKYGEVDASSGSMSVSFSPVGGFLTFNTGGFERMRLADTGVSTPNPISAGGTPTLASHLMTKTAVEDLLTYKANSGVAINTTAPLTGGGTLTTSRTLAIDTFTATVKGAVPPPTTATGKFLKDDGTWATITPGMDQATADGLYVNITGDTITSGALAFGSRFGQHLNMYSTTNGMGVQNGVQYQRVGTTSAYSWFKGGVHDDVARNPGAGGTEIMYLDNFGALLTLNGFQAHRTGGGTGKFIRIYDDEVFAWDAGAIAPLKIQRAGASGTTSLLGPVRIPNQIEGPSATTANHPFQIGSTTSENMRFGSHDIQTVSNGVPSELWINYFGGKVSISTGGLDVFGPVTVAGSGSTVTLAVAPTVDLHAATKKYVDDAVNPPVLRIYTADATWTKPAGLRYVAVEVVGGGGGSGGCPITAAAQGSAGGGGGGGGYAYKVLLATALAATVAVTVGAGGTAGTTTTAGGIGGVSSFGAHASANGGTGGGFGVVRAAGWSANGGGGGTATGGDLNVQGENSDAGIAYAANGVRARGGGSLYGSHGDNSGSVTGAVGSVGRLYGGGASGSFNTASEAAARAGAAGAAGVVIVREFF